MEAGPGRRFLKQLAETLELVLDAYRISSIVSRSSKSSFLIISCGLHSRGTDIFSWSYRNVSMTLSLSLVTFCRPNSFCILFSSTSLHHRRDYDERIGPWPAGDTRNDSVLGEGPKFFKPCPLFLTTLNTFFQWGEKFCRGFRPHLAIPGCGPVKGKHWSDYTSLPGLPKTRNVLVCEWKYVRGIVNLCLSVAYNQGRLSVIF